MPHHTSHRRDILIGGALLAVVAISTGGVIAEAAPAATECTTARQDVTERQQELADAVAAYRKQTSVAAAAQATYQRLQADEKATAADIEAARLVAYNAQTKATTLFAAQRSAGVALQEAVRVAEGTCATSEPQPPHEPPHTTPGDDHPRPPQHPRPEYPRGPIHRPAPLIHVESSSTSQATAVAAGGPGVVAVPVSDTHDEGWFGGWFGGSGDGGSGDGPVEGAGGAGATVAAPEQTGSSLPLGAVDTGDGSAGGLDLGHIGMAVAGLGALGLAGAGGAALAGRGQRRP